MEKNASEILSPLVIKTIQEAIASNQGNEVFFVGFVDAGSGKVVDIEPVVFGATFMTSVFMEKALLADVIIHNHPSGNLTPSVADMQVSGKLMNESGTSSLIVNNDVSRVKIIFYAPLLHQKETIFLDEEEVLKLFLPQGKIAQEFPFFELRHSQEIMVKKIIQAYNEGNPAFIEAGTGTGKSLAYLIPSIIWAIQNKEKVVISTHTKNLQSQLTEKDLPLLSKILDQNFNYALAKGRSNYLCKKKLDEALKDVSLQQEQGILFTDEDEKKLEILKGIQQWSLSHKEGDLEELSLETFKEVRDDMRSTSDLCMHRKCPFFDSCFVNLARQRVFSSQVIIANHHYLLSQFSLEYKEIPYRLLPHFSRLVVDEAHNFKKSAITFLQESASYLGLLKSLNQIYSFYKKGKRGQLNSLVYYLKPFNQEEAEKIIEIVDKNLKPFLTKWRDEIALFFQDLYAEVTTKHLKGKETTFRLKEDNFLLFSQFKTSFLSLMQESEFFESYMSQIFKLLKTLPEDFMLSHDLLFKGLEKNTNLILNGLEFFYKLFSIPIEETALWIQIDSYYKNLSLNQSRLEAKDFFKATLHNPQHSIVFTSATLSIAGNFTDIKEDLALDSEKVIEEILPSPFNYSKQCKVLVPKDIPSPKGADSLYSPFIQHALPFVFDLISMAQGGVFVLCTSFTQIKLLKEYLVKNHCPYPLLVHGELSRTLMLDQFKSLSNAVLLGTDSFWEGVDIQGDALRMVILFKLPFRPPSDPVTEATHEALKKRGENPFLKVEVPDAVIRFKQGFGRLIRSKEDKGIVAILDNRVMEQPYGRTFVNSLPIKAEEIFYSQTPHLLKEAHSFFINVSRETKK